MRERMNKSLNERVNAHDGKREKKKRKKGEKQKKEKKKK